MSAKDYSPFTPGQPVTGDLFVGRLDEVQSLTHSAGQATTGRLKVAWLAGERGIGKSSLASVARRVAEKEHKSLGLHIFLGGVTSLEMMVRRIIEGLLKHTEGESWFDRVKRLVKDKVKQVGLFGLQIEFTASDAELRQIVNNFAPTLRNLLAELGSEKKGLFLILDDINGLASSREFADWLKSLVDEIATSQAPVRLFLLLAGLDARRRSLIELQPSLARVFDIVEIKPWSRDESRSFFSRSFEKVNVRLEKEALESLVRFTGGLPVFAHEIGDAVFKVDADGVIDQTDALRGVLAAAEIVGRKHIEPGVFDAIRSKRYRAILRKLADEPFAATFTRKELISKLNVDERKVLDNFLTKMKSLGVIHGDSEVGVGGYAFDNNLHRLYFWLEAELAKQKAK